MGLLSDWEAVLISKDSNVKNGDDLLPTILDSMGSREEILAKLKDSYHSLSISDPRQVVLHGGDFNVHFDMGEDDPVRMIKLYIDGDILFVLQNLCQRYNWKVFNPLLNEFIDVEVEQKAISSEKDPESNLQVNLVGTYTRYFGATALLLVLDAVVSSYIGAAYLKTAMGLLISLFTWYVVFRFGMDNGFVSIRHAVSMGFAVSLALAGINMVKYWNEASAIEGVSVLTAMAAVVLVRTTIYTLICYLGIRFREGKKEDNRETPYIS